MLGLREQMKKNLDMLNNLSFTECGTVIHCPTKPHWSTQFSSSKIEVTVDQGADWLE